MTTRESFCLLLYLFKGLDVLGVHGVGSVHLSMESRYEFACVDHVETDQHSHCSTLTISCDEDEHIQINEDGISHGMINTTRPDGQCSNNITVCKTFIHGCCAADGYSSIEKPSRDDSQPVRDKCDQTRKCSVVPSELNFLTTKEFLMVEYNCVEDQMIDICGYKTGTLLTRQNRSRITYSHSDGMTEDSRKSCHCDVSSLPVVNMTVNLVDVKLGSKDKNCTPARLKISNSLDLASGQLSNLSLKTAEPFTVELDVYFDNPPSIWIEVEAPGGNVTVNCSSRTYALETNIGKANDTSGNLNTTEFQRREESCIPSFATTIAVPVAAVVFLIAVLIIVLAVRYRLRKTSTQEFKALDRASANTQRIPSYYTVEPHALEDGRTSSFNETNAGLNYPATAAALKQNLTPNDVTTGIELDRLTVPKVSYYERISMSDIQSDPNVKNKLTASGVAVHGEMENDRRNIQDVNMVKEREKKDGVSPAAYDKLTFTLPPACKLPHYQGLVLDDEAAEDMKKHTADPTSITDDGKSQNVNLATSIEASTHTTDQIGVVHEEKGNTAYLTVVNSGNSHTAFLSNELADGGNGCTVDDTLVATETKTNNADSTVANSAKNHMMDLTVAGAVQSYTTDPTADDDGTSHTVDSAGAGEVQSHIADPTVSNDRNSKNMGKALVANVL